MAYTPVVALSTSDWLVGQMAVAVTVCRTYELLTSESVPLEPVVRRSGSSVAKLSRLDSAPPPAGKLLTASVNCVPSVNVM